MKKLIIIGLLALCAECAWAENYDMDNDYGAAIKVRTRMISRAWQKDGATPSETESVGAISPQAFRPTKQGYTHKEVAQASALVMRSVEDSRNRKAEGRSLKPVASSTKQIAELWGIDPGEIDKPINIFAER